MKDLRQFLKGMELETEQIDTIMAEVGKNFSTLKEERDRLKDLISFIEKRIDERNEFIDDYLKITNNFLDNIEGK